MKYSIGNLTKIFVLIWLFLNFLDGNKTASEQIRKNNILWNNKENKNNLKIAEIKWEKIQGNGNNYLKNNGEIIWEPLSDKESYMELNRNIKEENLPYQKFNKNTQIEPFLPLNNFLEFTDGQTDGRKKSLIE